MEGCMRKKIFALVLAASSLCFARPLRRSSRRKFPGSDCCCRIPLLPQRHGNAHSVEVFATSDGSREKTSGLSTDIPGGVVSPLGWKESQLPARALGLRLYSMEVQSPDDFDKAFKDATRARVGAVDIVPNALVSRNQKRIADLAVKSRLPSIYGLMEFVDFGGLMAYGPDRSDLFRSAAAYVDKILKGRKPADLPVERPTKFEMVINLKTAKALNLTIPPSVLYRADKLIR